MMDQEANHGDEVDFYLKQLVAADNKQRTLQRQYEDLLAAHGKSGNVRAKLAEYEEAFEQLQQGHKSKADEVIGLKCDAQKDKDEIARLQASLRRYVADAGAGGTTADMTQKLDSEIAQYRLESDKLREQLTACNHTIASMTKDGKRDGEEIQRINRLVQESASTVSSLQRQDRQSKEAADRLRRQVSDLEAQQRSQKAPARPPAAAAADLASLERIKEQLAGALQRNASLDNQAKFDHETINRLRQQLADLQRLAPSSDDADRKRVHDLREINTTLATLARDMDFQQDLARPLVKVAIGCWGGRTDYTAEETEAARYDEGVRRVYPRLYAFQQVCDGAYVPFPADHIIARKTGLTVQAIVQAYGPEFVGKFVSTVPLPPLPTTPAPGTATATGTAPGTASSQWSGR